jgi:hypothetical protein
MGHFRVRENRMPLQARYALGRADLTAVPPTFQATLPTLNKGSGALCFASGVTPLSRWAYPNSSARLSPCFGFEW